MPLRVLVVDDFEPFRGYLRSTLGQTAEFQLIGEAAEGESAIRLAADLQPDLVLLDVALPKMSGFDVARRLGQVAPKSKVLFVSQQFSLDMVEAGFRAGGLGYVHKVRAARELLPALKAVAAGRYYVGGIFSEGGPGPAARHQVQFFSDAVSLQQRFAGYIAAHLKAGTPAIMETSTVQSSAILEQLARAGLDVNHALRTRILVAVDASELLDRIMPGEVLGADRFFDVAGALLDATARKEGRDGEISLALCREAPPALLAKGAGIACRLEGLWSLMARRFGVDVLCAYDLARLQLQDGVMECLRAEHSGSRDDGP
jgi:DNA-binding NarL/FixJ family response regulator